MHVLYRLAPVPFLTKGQDILVDGTGWRLGSVDDGRENGGVGCCFNRSRGMRGDRSVR